MASKDYQNQLHRLREEQQKALQDTDDNIRQWEKFKSDYEALRDRLKTLPDMLTHDVMVPFGKMGFMPGQLVHTNEILVLLGDNWFVDRSAKQAMEIVARRTAAVDKQLEDLHKQRKLLEPRHDFTQDLQAMAEGSGDMFEIREDYDEEKEKQWREKHKENVTEHRKRLKKVKTKESVQKKEMTDEQLWERLDELERKELRDGEMEKLGPNAEATADRVDKQTSEVLPTETAQEHKTFQHPEPSLHTGQKYRSSDNETDTSTRSLDSDDFDEAEEDRVLTDSDEKELLTKGKVIHFKHSQQQAADRTTDISATASESISIASPADIYTVFKPPEGPTSILKKPKSEMKKKARERRERKRVVEFETASEEEDNKTNPIQEARTRVELHKAFTGTVREKVPSELPASHCAQREKTKPVSKFKMRSGGHNPGTSQMTETKPDLDGLVLKSSPDNENVKPVSKFRAQRNKLAER